MNRGSYEVSASIAGRLGDKTIPLAVHTIFMSPAAMWCAVFSPLPSAIADQHCGCPPRYMIPISLSTAAAALIGNYLGAGAAGHAKRVAKIGFWCNVACARHPSRFLRVLEPHCLLMNVN